MNDQNVLEKIKEIIAEVSTNVEAEKITESSSLMDDLGLDSLDLLELIFKFEEHFNIRIERGQITKAAQGDLTDQEFIVNGMVTEMGIKRIKEVMTEIPAEKFPEKLSVNQIANLFTPATFARIISEQIEKQK
ncbi:MAG: DUF1493 family protein [Oligoflexia bacterium]|nr:DUF1493 family protein [Oligoflexia bacterium]